MFIPQEFCSQIELNSGQKKPQMTAEFVVPTTSKQRASFDGCFAEETALFIVVSSALNVSFNQRYRKVKKFGGAS